MSTAVTMAKALNAGLREELTRDERLLLMGEDVTFGGGLFGVTENLVDDFGPERIIDMPISEAGFTGFGLGCAVSGSPAVVEIQIMDFAALAMDQICNRAAKLRYMTGGQIGVPLVVRMPGASRIGLAAQHSQSLEGWFINAPGLKVVTPATPSDAKGLLKSAIRDGNPIVFIEHRLLYSLRGEVADDELVPLGKARIVRDGSDITLIANSICVRVAESAAQMLESDGISVELIDLRTVKPLDRETIVASVAKTHRVIVINEGNEVGGVAAEVASLIAGSEAFFDLEAPIKKVGVPDVPVPYAKELEEAVLPQAARVVTVAKQLLELS